MNTFIFLRHADTAKDSNLHPTLWSLSDTGIQQSIEVCNEDIFKTIDIVYVSSEQKTFLTIEPLMKVSNIPLYKTTSFDEVKRGNKFLTKEEFEYEKELQLKDFSYHAFDGESCDEALERFKKGVDEIEKKYKDKNILVVTHGTVLNLYFAYLLGKTEGEDLKDRWNKTKFCAYGIVKDKIILKDII